MTPSELQTLLAPGDYSFAELSLQTQAELAALVRPGEEGFFTEEQIEWMQNFYLILPESQVAELNALNQPNLILAPFPTADDRLCLPVSALTDTRPGETFEQFRQLLFSLKIQQVLPAEFPQSPSPYPA